MIVVVMHKSCG